MKIKLHLTGKLGLQPAMQLKSDFSIRIGGWLLSGESREDSIWREPNRVAATARTADVSFWDPLFAFNQLIAIAI